MSTTRERADEPSETSSSFLQRYAEWYHIPVLSVLFAFMLWVRVQSYDRFIQGETILYRGNDPWYHHRAVMYTVENWPQVILFDPWTGYPDGTTAGTFGTFFDQILATVALLIGLGNPDEYTVGLVVMFSAAVFGALALFPTYYIGKRLGGRFGGLFGALVLALLPGTFLSYGLVGFGDHHMAEVFFMATAVAALMVALSVTEREQPVYELVEDRDFAALRRPIAWSAIAGFAVGLYMWTWSPGVVLVGIVGIYFALTLTATYLKGQSPEPLAFVGVVSMSVAGVMMLLSLQELDFSATGYTILHVVLPLGVAAGCAFLAWLARYWERETYDPTLYPATVGGILLVGLGAFALLLPEAFDEIRRNVERTIAFGTGDGARTIGEAQPLMSRTDPQVGITGGDVLFQEYGMMFYTAALAVGFMVVKPLVFSRDTRKQVGALVGVLLVGVLLVADLPYGLLGVAIVFVVLSLAGERRSDRLFVLIWLGFVTGMAFTQIRFNYYLAVGVAVANAYLLSEVLGYLDLSGGARTRLADIESYQVLAVGLALMVAMPVLVVPMEVGHTGQEPITTNNAMQVGENTAPGAVAAWDDSLQWMSENTPEQGADGGAGEPMDYYGTFDVGQGEYEYPDGSYGVMSWWDYGHWITVQAERAPHANPFQQNADSAANYLLAPSEDDAQAVADEQIGGPGPADRYVMVDWEMVSPYSKFHAPTVFYDEENVSTDDFYDRVYRPVGENERLAHGFFLKEQRYYESQMNRLYQYHGSAVEPEPVVVEWDEETDPEADVTYKRTPRDPDTQVLNYFDNMTAAEEYVEENENAQIGGVGQYPTERVDALEEYRLVNYSEHSAYESRDYQDAIVTEGQGVGAPLQLEVLDQLFNRNSPAWVKSFERVDGATIEGEGPANEEIRAGVELRIPATNETFVYSQYAETGDDGQFEMTVPYATTGYDEVGDEHTNVSVRATGEYHFVSPPDQPHQPDWHGSANVSESQVIGVDDEPVTVEMEEIEGEVDETVPEEDGDAEGDSEDGADDAPDEDTDENDAGDDETEDENTTDSIAPPAAVDRTSLPTAVVGR